jgi:periplasmic protein TonB
MFDVLVVSRPSNWRTPRWAVGSLCIHVLLLGVVVATTRGSLDTLRRPIADTTLVFLQRLQPPVTKPEPPPEDQDRVVRPTVVPVPAPPKGFQTVVPPKDIPTTIPPVDLTAKALDPRDFTGRGVEGGIARGEVGGTDKVGPAPEEIYTVTTADPGFAPAALVSQPAPRYPPVLQQIGLSGRVLLQFVVDTTGHVEPASIQVIESTHEGFEPPAREAVAAAIFHPARLGPRPVRQLAQQGVRFIARQ